MHDFPHTINNPLGGKVTIENDDALIGLFKSFIHLQGDVFYSFVKQAICPNRLRDPWAVSMVERYFYCQSTGVPPYSGAYDDQPAVWLDVSRLIQSTTDDIKMNCTCNIHRPVNG